MQGGLYEFNLLNHVGVVAKRVCAAAAETATHEVVFAPTRKRDAGQNPGATKIPLPLWAGDKNK